MNIYIYVEMIESMSLQQKARAAVYTWHDTHTYRAETGDEINRKVRSLLAAVLIM